MTEGQASTEEVKELYERSIAGKYKGDYEFKRWFSTPRLRLDYVQTRVAIAERLKGIEFSACLEFGPGSGTFTQLVYRHNPAARFDLIDISEEMKKQFTLEMRQTEGVRYLVSDFMLHDFGSTTYDLFYSVRAAEYVDDKERFFRKVYGLLSKGGRGIIVTKNPRYTAAERGATTRKHHRGKMDSDELLHLLSEAGFTDIALYPVIVRLPLIERLTMRFTERYFERIYRKPYTGRQASVVESYLVTFKKP